MHDKLTQWAARWGIPSAAVADLRHRLQSTEPTDPTGAPTPGTEAATQQSIRIEASRRGLRLWRNNVGMAHTDSGAVVRFGLANDSQEINRRVKSSDLIGIKPVVVTADMAGVTIGQFVSREVKRPGWRYRGTARERAQKRWLDLVTAYGGDASFCTGYDISY